MTGKKLFLTFLFGLVIGQSAISALEPANTNANANEDYDGDYYDDESIEMYHEKAELKAVTVAKEGIQVVTVTTVSPVAVTNATGTGTGNIAEESKNQEQPAENIKSQEQLESQKQIDPPQKSDEIPTPEKKDTETQQNFDIKIDDLKEQKSDEDSEPEPNEPGPIISLAGDEMENHYDSHYYDEAIEQNVYVEKIYANNDRKTVDVKFEAETNTDADDHKDKMNNNIFGPRFTFSTARTDTIFSGIFIGFLALTFATILFAFYRGLVWFNRRMKTEIVYERMEAGGDPVFQQ